MPRVSFYFVLLSLASFGASAEMNDSGQSACYDNTASAACDPATFPGTDGRFGRDAASIAGVLSKQGSGVAGFDFTKLDAAGNPLPANAATWRCVRDNTSKLTWEAKTDDGGLHDRDWTYAWYSASAASNGGDSGIADAGIGDGVDNCMNGARCDTEKFVADVNASGLCGANDWRLPTLAELLGVAHFGANGGLPLLDPQFFSDTGAASDYWTGDSDPSFPAFSRFMSMVDGLSYSLPKGLDLSVRLVRNTK